MKKTLSQDALNQLFLEARTYNSWSDTPVTDEQIHQIYDLMKMGPTSANCCPARMIFVRSEDAKARLARLCDAGNDKKILAAPVTVIIGHDMSFPNKMAELFPHNPAAAHWFDAPEVRAATAFRNGTLQGAYFMMAARAIGLDCGPMSGFDQAAVDAEFFAGTSIKSNFICTIGVGTQDNLYPRSPRLQFSDAAEIM